VGRKWSPPSKVFAVLGVVFAVAAFSLVRGYSARVQSLQAEVGDPTPVAVAAQAIARGEVLGAVMFRIRLFPAAFAPPGAVRDPGSVAGRVLLAPLAAGQPLTVEALAPQDAGPVAGLVPSGLRAVPLVTSLVAAAIRPGDRVDVLATFPGPHAHTETVASGLEVLRVLQPGDSSTGSAFGTGAASVAGTVLMLLVTADQTEQLAYARAFADVFVVLDGAQEVVSAEGP
jgi:Flp pilus assembly protein CpaB